MTTTDISTEVVLPIFVGDTLEAHVQAWDQATGFEKMATWRKAAICASLKRMTGSRTDLDGAQTVIETFCHEVNGGKGMSRDHFSRMAKTYTVFAELFVTGTNELLDNPRLSFKTFFVAANFSPQPRVALQEALSEGWSGNRLRRELGKRKKQVVLDGDGLELRDEDDDDSEDVAEWRTMKVGRARDGRRRLSSVRKDTVPAPPNLTPVYFEMNPTELRMHEEQMQDLRAWLAQDDTAILRQAIDNYHELIWRRQGVDGSVGDDATTVHLNHDELELTYAERSGLEPMDVPPAIRFSRRDDADQEPTE